MMNARTVETHGVSIATEAFGDASHPAILLLMGAMASATWWPEGFCEQLARRGRYVIRYDHRDTGRSTSSPPGQATYSSEDLAWDAVGVLDGLGVASAHWVGMSLGGYLAQMVAVAHPERVRTLTLIASEPLAPGEAPVPGIDPAVLAWHAQAATLDWSDRKAVLDYQVGAWRLLNGSAHAFAEAHIRELATADYARTPNPLTAFNHATLRNLENWSGRMGEIQAPALIIHGTEDRVLPYAHALALHTALPGSQLLTLEGTGHELHPADWPVILDAIERHTAEGRGTAL